MTDSQLDPAGRRAPAHPSAGGTLPPPSEPPMTPPGQPPTQPPTDPPTEPPGAPPTMPPEPIPGQPPEPSPEPPPEPPTQPDQPPPAEPPPGAPPYTPYRGGPAHRSRQRGASAPEDGEAPEHCAAAPPVPRRDSSRCASSRRASSPGSGMTVPTIPRRTGRSGTVGTASTSRRATCSMASAYRSNRSS